MRKRIFSQLPVYSNPHANETMARYLQSNISQLFQTKHSVRKSGVISSRRKKNLKVFYNLLSVLFLRPFNYSQNGLGLGSSDIASHKATHTVAKIFAKLHILFEI